MSDVAWINMAIWPWEDEWLDQDPELHQALRDLDLTGDLSRTRFGGDDPERLTGAMNGSVDYADGEVSIDGEMRGGSWEIRESGLLEILQDRGLAYRLIGSPKYEWDGDETYWHPGMEKPSEAIYTEGSGCVLTARDYQAMQAQATEDGTLDPSVLEAQITAFFTASHEWTPPEGYEPALKTEQEEASVDG